MTWSASQVAPSTAMSMGELRQRLANGVAVLDRNIAFSQLGTDRRCRKALCRKGKSGDTEERDGEHVGSKGEGVRVLTLVVI